MQAGKAPKLCLNESTQFSTGYMTPLHVLINMNHL